MVIFLTSIFISNVQEESEYNESIKNEKNMRFLYS